jgi:DNA-binding transcriptional regulator YdaS (Cro superfamily)
MKRRKKRAEENAVAKAVAAIGGPTKAAVLCGVSNTAVHRWIRSGRIILLRHAVQLSRASGIAIEEFLGDQKDSA